MRLGLLWHIELYKEVGDSVYNLISVYLLSTTPNMWYRYPTTDCCFFFLFLYTTANTEKRPSTNNVKPSRIIDHPITLATEHYRSGSLDGEVWKLAIGAKEGFQNKTSILVRVSRYPNNEAHWGNLPGCVKPGSVCIWKLIFGVQLRAGLRYALSKLHCLQLSR